MTQPELRRFIRACVRHNNKTGDHFALDLGREAFRRLQDRA